MRKILLFGLALAVLVGLLSIGQQGSTLATIKARGKLICGVNKEVPGFGFLKPDGTFSGFDVEYCKAIAAAVLKDPNAVTYRPLTAAERFVALNAGEVDVLIRNTTWTLARDAKGGNNLDFGPTTFYDGQGFMVPKAKGVKSTRDLKGATICVLKGTTTELNLADHFRALGIPFTPLVFDTHDAAFAAYLEGRCDAITADKSALAARRSTFKNPEEHVILPETISKEPLGPVYRHGDNEWGDIVNWVVFATFFAEEKGITQANVATFKSDDPETKRFLGQEGNLGEQLGLDKEWAVRVIQAVGNYGEIYARNIGPIGIPRAGSLNELWTRGGLIYAPPFR